VKGSWWIFLGLAAAAFGAWWWFRRRQPGAASPFAFLDPPSPYTMPGSYTPPVPPSVNPSGGSSWKDSAAEMAGNINAVALSAACVAAGGGPLCVAAAPIGKVAGTYGAKATIAVGSAAVTGAKAVGSGGKKVLKAIIPGW
jgi:hypothetical protein